MNEELEDFFCLYSDDSHHCLHWYDEDELGMCCYCEDIPCEFDADEDEIYP